MIDFEIVKQDTFLILPLVVVSLGALLVLMLDVFRKDIFKKNKWPSGYASIAVLIIALFSAVIVAPEYRAQESAFFGTVFVDPFTSFVTALILAVSVLCILIGKDFLGKEGVLQQGEYHSLYLMATAGAILMVSAAEFITLFIGLETMSMALYAMCGAALKRSRSAESALKYFFLGSYSSTFFLFGIALLYGLTGSFTLTEIAAGLDAAPQGLTTIAVGLVLVGILFKIGAAPLHFWVADVYQGAPTAATVYMASVVKIAAICVGLRIMWLSFGSEAIYELWVYPIWLAALLTMVVGNISALRQQSVKRMLAYSSIAHAGYMLMGFLPSAEYGGGAAILYYLVAYTVMTLGSFGVVIAVSAENSQEDGDNISRFKGLSKRRPVLAAAMCLFLLSLAGLPPGMAGMLGKFYLFNAVVRAEFVGLAVLAVLCSAVSCYYYLRVIVAMYFMEGEESAAESDINQHFSTALAGTLAVCAILTIALGIQPSFLYDAVAAIF